MALLGLSLILATLVLLCMRRPAWLDSLLGAAPRPPIRPSQGSREKNQESDGADRSSDRHAVTITRPLPNNGQRAQQIPVISHDEEYQDPAAEPRAELGPRRSHDSISDDGTTTPKASAAPPPATNPCRPSPSPRRSPAPRHTDGPSALSIHPHAPSSPPLIPPATPFRRRIRPRRPGPRPGCSTLAPPPTHSSKPTKPSRAVVLSPGHSPLDWARLSGHPTADLRGLPPGSPYLRVTPSMLKRMTGRKGKDAWTVLGGRVYNMSPYLPFHPGVSQNC